MAGRTPIPVYTYALDGKYQGKFDNMSQFRKVFYPDDLFKRPLFKHRELDIYYEYIPEAQTIAFKERVYRDTVKRIVRIIESDFCKDMDSKYTGKPVEVYNLKGEKIAEFKTPRLALKLMPHLSGGLIHGQLRTTLKEHLKSPDSHNESGLFFKYKNEKTP